MPANGLDGGGAPPVRGVVMGPVGLALARASAGATAWIEPADTGALAALEVLADAIDAINGSDNPDLEGLRKLCATFLNGLAALGLTPVGRGRLSVEELAADDGAALVALVGGRTA